MSPDEYDEDEHGEPCDDCETPDACADYGCYQALGLPHPSEEP